MSTYFSQSDYSVLQTLFDQLDCMFFYHCKLDEGVLIKLIQKAERAN